MNGPIVWTILVICITQNCCICDENVVVTAAAPINEKATSKIVSTTTATTTMPKVYISPEKYRLPRTIFPEFYKLTIFTHINDAEGFKFYGDVRIKVILFGY